ncbi:MAG: hypothetical protein JW936_11840 [Sedimentisphaerales bacterium]|nr:hypothetical protein [Sedimentisphaerales bacterium]
MGWTNPLVKKGVVKQTCAEVTPFVFRDRFYLLENFKRAEDFPGTPLDCDMFHEDGFRIRDVEKNIVISVPLMNHYFATAFVWEDRVYSFCGDLGWDQPWWHIKKYKILSSDDLITWSKPEVIIEANPDENLFNNGVIHDGDRFIMLIETDDPRWTKFTFKFYQSKDLRNWSLIDGALYGTEKYVGGPALYCFDGYYYVLYLNFEGFDEKGAPCYRTRIARSKDLFTWQEAPEDRVFLDFDPNHQVNPQHYPGVMETNASDVELCQWKGKTLAYFSGGNQQIGGDLQLAEYDGGMKDLLESFFK